MPEMEIPLTGPAYENADEANLADFSARIQDCYQNELGWLIGRPGLVSDQQLLPGVDVDGLYWWSQARAMLALCATPVLATLDKP